MTTTIFAGARVFDGQNAPVDEAFDVVVADGEIKDVVAAMTARAGDADIVDCRGKTLMPGLIDAHVHIYAATMRVDQFMIKPPTYFAYFATRFLRGALDRGFTTVRDVGGADIGAASALQEGLVRGSRLYYGGRMLSQTGGHGDFRSADLDAGACACGRTTHLSVIADGVDAVRAAVREELRRGAHHIKIMGSGGVMSPNDPLTRTQYSEEEIRVAVEEATRHGSYVTAHCHPAEAIRRCVEFGVRCIEHGTLIDKPTAEFVAGKGAYVVPTMAVQFALLDDGPRYGLTDVSLQKLKQIIDFALTGMETMRDAGVKMGLGTDLLGEHHVRQSTEFELRARVLKPVEILRSACAVNAEILGETGKLGCVRPGAYADLLVINGDPTKDISVLARPECMPVVMKAGAFHRRVA